MNKLQFKLKILDAAPMQAHREMLNPAVKEFVLQKLSREMIQFIEHEFPTLED